MDSSPDSGIRGDRDSAARGRVYTGMGWFFSNGGPTNEDNEELLIRFINKRYKTSMHTKKSPNRQIGA
jgi:hypothetical protein